MASNSKSAGVTARTFNQTGPTALSPLGIPAGVIGTAKKGPAFVPVTVPTTQDFVVSFGSTGDGAVDGPLAVSEWLTAQQSATFIRVLGIGDGNQRVSSGNNKGKVSTAGFVVGERQPQAVLSGALGSNVYAVSQSGSDVGPEGRTYFLGAFMSQSVGSTYLTEAGLSAQAVPLLRGMIMAASGVVLTLSASVSGSNTVPSKTLAAVPANIKGSMTGSVNLASGKQEFVMFLNGHRGIEAEYPNFITASFDPTAANYFGSILNKNPLMAERAGYTLYSHFDVHPALAVPTGSGILSSELGAQQRIAFLVTGASTRNSGSVTAPNFENFEDRFKPSESPWVTSQLFGGKAENLFKIWTLSDGSGEKVKISVENISPSLSDENQYGTFDILVRDLNDSDRNRAVLEQWRGLTLDSDAPNYIARVIGDNHPFYNFEALEGEQKIETEGEYQNNSRYIRVQVAEAVRDKNVDATAIPFGFRGNQHLMTSGSAPMVAFSDTAILSTTNPFYKLVQPPVPMRKNLSKGSVGNTSGDRALYWGVQFEKVISVSETNASTVLDTSLGSYMKYFPMFHTEWQNVAVRDNPDVSDTAANGIIDADRFNNNMFSIGKIRVPVLASSGLPDVNSLDSWVYVREGNIVNGTPALTRALTVDDLKDPSIRQVAKFSFFVEGGFDGVRIFDKDTQQISNKAVVEELLSPNRLLSSGPTVKAYERALSVMADSSEVDIQLLTMPGIRHRYLTDQGVAVAENRFDALYIMDIEEKDAANSTIISPDVQIVSVRNTVNDFRARGLNSSFAATFFPNQLIRDNISNVIREVPPSVAVLGAFAKNDAVAYSWFAPAGFARGSLDNVQEAAVKLSRENMDDLYSVNINPIVSFPDTGGTVVWGQKTLLATSSSLERINVRRLLLTLRRQIRKIANRFLFEPNRASTLARFSQLCNPVLKRIQDQKGVSQYLVKIDTSTTTEVDIQNKTIRGKILIVPVRSLEFLELNFTLANNGNFNIV